MSNPVDDARFTRQFIRPLRQHVDAFTHAMAPDRAAYRDIEAARLAAVSWVYYSVLVAWLEDHGLIDPWLRKDAAEGRAELLQSGSGPLAWLSMSYAAMAVHPATHCLLDQRYSHLWDRTPPAGVVRDLIDWWSTDAPSFRYEAEVGPQSISGWLAGELLQAVSDARRKAHALCQTPWWVCDFILDGTLLPAAAEFRDETLRTIDPACGTGHFLIRKISYLWELYTTGMLSARQIKGADPVIGWTPVDAEIAIGRILEGCHGVELDPLTAAVARLRYLVAIGDLVHRAGLLDTLRLDTIPTWIRPPIVVGDSLLARKVSKAEYAELYPKLAQIANLGHDTAAEAPAAVESQASAQGSLFDLGEAV